MCDLVYCAFNTTYVVIGIRSKALEKPGWLAQLDELGMLHSRKKRGKLKFSLFEFIYVVRSPVYFVCRVLKYLYFELVLVF